jgi:hypothetical protein
MRRYINHLVRVLAVLRLISYEQRGKWFLPSELLDNLGRPSARQPLPEHQQIHVGQLIPMSPDGKYGVYVKEFKENEWILWDDKEGVTTRFWGLHPEGKTRTRLVTRICMKYLWNSPAALFNPLVKFGDIIMMRKCLLGIKERAEKCYNDDLAPRPRSSQLTKA